MRGVATLLAFSAASFAAETDAAQALRILNANCAQCHSKAMTMSSLDLSSRESALKGGSRGAVIVPGQAAASKQIGRAHV